MVERLQHVRRRYHWCCKLRLRHAGISRSRKSARARDGLVISYWLTRFRHLSNEIDDRVGHDIYYLVRGDPSKAAARGKAAAQGTKQPRKAAAQGSRARQPQSARMPAAQGSRAKQLRPTRPRRHPLGACACTRRGLPAPAELPGPRGPRGNSRHRFPRAGRPAKAGTPPGMHSTASPHILELLVLPRHMRGQRARPRREAQRRSRLLRANQTRTNHELTTNNPMRGPSTDQELTAD